jgi:hypothetical protein
LFDIIQKYRLSGRKVLICMSATQALLPALTSADGDGAKVPASPDDKPAGEPGGSAADGLKLLRAFLNIRDATLRRSVVHLMELLARTQARR